MNYLQILLKPLNSKGKTAISKHNCLFPLILTENRNVYNITMYSMFIDAIDLLKTMLKNRERTESAVDSKRTFGNKQVGAFSSMSDVFLNRTVSFTRKM